MKKLCDLTNIYVDMNFLVCTPSDQAQDYIHRGICTSNYILKCIEVKCVMCTKSCLLGERNAVFYKEPNSTRFAVCHLCYSKLSPDITVDIGHTIQPPKSTSEFLNGFLKKP